MLPNTTLSHTFSKVSTLEHLLTHILKSQRPSTLKKKRRYEETFLNNTRKQKQWQFQKNDSKKQIL
jgi:hypothetical protein